MDRHEPWQLEGSAPELYQRYIVPAVTALWATDLVERASPRPGERALDVACGTGVVARLVGERVGRGHVAGLDINAGMLAVARSLPTRHGPAIDWHEGSALDMPFADEAFDLVLCQLGLQFFPDRPAALREMRRVLTPGGRLALNVYDSIEANPAARVISDSLDRHFGPHASAPRRAEHVLADTDELRRLVERARFREVTIRTTTQRIRFPSAKEYVRITMAASPLAGIVSGMATERRDALVEELAAELSATLAPYAGDTNKLIFPQQAHVVLARK